MLFNFWGIEKEGKYIGVGGVGKKERKKKARIECDKQNKEGEKNRSWKEKVWPTGYEKEKIEKNRKERRDEKDLHEEREGERGK